MCTAVNIESCSSVIVKTSEYFSLLGRYYRYSYSGGFYESSNVREQPGFDFNTGRIIIQQRIRNYAILRTK